MLIHESYDTMIIYQLAKLTFFKIVIILPKNIQKIECSVTWIHTLENVSTEVGEYCLKLIDCDVTMNYVYFDVAFIKTCCQITTSIIFKFFVFLLFYSTKSIKNC
jgi:hypothetical protein